MSNQEQAESQAEMIDFVSDSLDVMGEVEHMILGFDNCKTVEEVHGTVDATFRLFHSLKGAAGFLDLQSVVNFTHQVEDALQVLREKPGLMRSHHVDIFLACNDLLRNMLIQVENEFHDQGFEEEIPKVVKLLKDHLIGSSPTDTIVEPLAIEANSIQKSTRVSKALTSSPIPPSLSKILYIEDEQGLRDIIQTHFEAELGVEVILAPSEDLGIELALEHKPDLILLDIMMPTYGRDAGFQVLAQLKAHPETSSIPVIMLTARLEHQIALKALELGADDFERKPFDLERLTEKVRFCAARQFEMKKKQEENRSLMGKLSDRMQDSQIDTKKFIRRNFFLEIMVNYYKDSFRCTDVDSLLILTLETTKLLEWQCTLALKRSDEFFYLSDYQDNEIGGFIIRGLHKEKETHIVEKNFAFFGTKEKTFSILIRNMKEIRERTSDPISDLKPNFGEISQCGEAIIEAFMARYAAF